jgi:uncharacterized LabA/DUF88 family protein
MRFQDMVASGHTPNRGVIHTLDTFVWHQRFTDNYDYELRKVVRTCYYTSVVGDETRVADIKRQLSQIQFETIGDDGGISGQIVPIVFKKLARSQKTRNVDIQVVIDVMRFAFTDEIERVYLASGDGDYLPLIDEVMRRGKQVEVLAFSSGLNPAIPYSVDRYFSLDPVFFDSKYDG